ncbi:MAG: pyridoxamine 5'-phosphate oxidase family protein [Negativicutes bacterium]
MMEPKVLRMLKEKAFFMGTACNNIPHVRPMRPFVDSHNNIWFVSHAKGEKVIEIGINNRVELCALGDNYEVVRLQGKLIPEQESSNSSQEIRRDLFQVLPHGLFSGIDDPEMRVYQFVIEHVIFRDDENAEIAELNFKTGR